MWRRRRKKKKKKIMQKKKKTGVEFTKRRLKKKKRKRYSSMTNRSRPTTMTKNIMWGITSRDIISTTIISYVGVFSCTV